MPRRENKGVPPVEVWPSDAPAKGTQILVNCGPDDERPAIVTGYYKHPSTEAHWLEIEGEMITHRRGLDRTYVTLASRDRSWRIAPAG